MCVAICIQILKEHNHVTCTYCMCVAKGRSGGETADPQSSYLWRNEHHHRPD